MEDPNTYNTAAQQEPSDTQSGHWQPALRPETPALPATPQLLDQHHSADILRDSVIAPTEESQSLQEDATEHVESHQSEMTELQTGPGAPFGSGDDQPTLNASETPIADSAATGETDELEDDGDEERLDPAWGIKRMSTAQILGSVNRTSSFPTFTTTASDPADPVPAEQVDVSQMSTTVLEVHHDADRDDHSPSVQSKPEFSWETHEDPETEHFLQGNDTMSPEVHNHNPEESRFEEGLPLMQRNDEEPVAELLNEHTRPAALADFRGDEDADFFSNMNGTHQSTPPELTRKSTSAVLGALEMKEQITDADPDQDFFAELQPQQPDTHASTFGSAPMQPAEEAPETKADNMEDMWNAMAEDDEFLVEDPDDLLPDSEPSSPSSFLAALKQDDDPVPEQPLAQTAAPQRPFPNRQSSANPYAPHQPSTTELSQLPGHVGFSQPALGSTASFQAQVQQQRPMAPQSTQSFVDQKGGYQSPYDLPMELSKPKKRPAVLQQVSQNKSVPPPPRSSSMTNKDLQSPFLPSGPTSAQPSPALRGPSGSVPPPARPTPSQSSSSFFEELPITSKPRQGSGGSRYTPQQGASPLAPPPMVSSPPQVVPAQPPPQAAPTQPSNAYSQFQLQSPERLDPFSSQPLQPTLPGAVPPTAQISNRYSPAPPATLAAPRTGPSPRYSPAPPPQTSGPPAVQRYASQPSVPQASPPIQPQRYPSHGASAPSPPAGSLPFQPRTSSPLVHHKSSVDESQQNRLDASHSQPPPASRYGPSHISSPPGSLSYSQGPYQSLHSSPQKAGPPVQPPRRSQTQSPSKQRPQPGPPTPQKPTGYRPASAHGHVAPMRTFSQVETAVPSQPHAQARGFVEQLDFIQPTDETRSDPLERWKGAPVFRFGFGGAVVSTFPKHVPRYSAGAVRPQIKPSVGEVLIRESKAVVETSTHITSFPGPLRVKSKKKELLTWLNGYISDLESRASSVYPSQSLPDPRKRHEEKILLWKVVKSMVEHDGALDSGDALKTVNAVMAPEVHAVDEATATQYREEVSPSIYRPSGTNVKPESVDAMAIETVRKHLLRGNRKEAVWHAVDNRLWSHAFLIASTMPRDTWKQVVSEFIKQEVKTAGANTQSLSTLYEVFGGNAEDCVDQLVPPSARAGLQMVSKIDSSGPTTNALDGLDKWRETLTLIINNRSHGDHQALQSLGRLLAEYGRIEAAHICFLFSRSASNPTIVGGLDDPQASIVLLGADHVKHPFDFARDLESILLTEVYEFATLVVTGSATAYMPYMSAYKLRHASLLADEGFKTKAQAYCDALTTTLRNTKVMSQYTPAFLGELEDFTNRLKQVPVHSANSWMGKPNLEKVSGSILSKLSNFVAGDDSDADSKGSGREATEAGPFAHVAGTPSLSRATSQSDINFSYPTSTAPAMPMTAAGSRYAPNGLTSTRSSSELTRGRPSLDSQRSPPSTSYAPNRPSPYDPVNMMQPSVGPTAVNPYQPLASPPTNHYQATPPQTSYMPDMGSNYSPHKATQDAYAPAAPAVQESYIPTPPPEQPLHQGYEPEMPFQPYEPTSQMQQEAASGLEQPSFGGYAPPDPSSSFAPPQAETMEADSAYAPGTQSYGYAPPDDNGYVPYVPEPDSPDQPKPRKPLMDDDADALTSQPAASDSDAARKAANDAAADAAFRAAAEADAARAKEKTVKPKGSGWLGGWWGGAKKSDSLDAGSGSSAKGGKEPAVYRAKLGESKMKLYYDKDLKKWVNPDNPTASSSAPTPPPPRAVSGTPGPPMSSGSMGPPPPRSVSAAPPMGSPALGLPDSGPPSRAGTPASGGSAPGIAATLPPGVNASLNEGAGMLAPSSGPPSRPGTAMSNASSIDDLLGAGPPMGSKRGAKGAKAKKGRYVDVMAQ